MASFEYQLLSRIIRTGDLTSALAWGIAADDFQTAECRALFTNLSAYFHAPATLGSVVGPTTLQQMYPTFQLIDDPSMTTEALCFEVRKNRLSTELRLMLQEVEPEIDAYPEYAAARILVKLDELENLGGGTQIADATEVFSPLPPPDYLCAALDIAKGVAPTLLVGEAFVGKTVLAQALAVDLMLGRRVWKQFSARQGRVLHLDFEQGKHVTYERYQRLAAAAGASSTTFHDRLGVVVMPDFFLDTPMGESELRRLAPAYDLIIVDSFRASAPGIDENSSEVRKVLDMMTRIAVKTDSAFLVLHHSNKQATGTRAGIRGSTAFREAASSVLLLREAVGGVEVIHDKARLSGHAESPFTLGIVDVPIAGNPRGGLDVVQLSPGTVQTTLEQQVLAAVARLGPCSKNAICKEVGGNRQNVLATVDRLLTQGNLGTDQSKVVLPTSSSSGSPLRGREWRSRAINVAPRVA